MLEKLIPKKYHRKVFELKQSILGRYATKSYSQEGEDLILNRIFGKKKGGFFLDIGAHHPLRFSNTYLFYKKGWTGINIDAMPGSMKAFASKRSKDINLEIAISKEPKMLTYYSFVEPAINGFDRQLSEQRIKDGEALLKKIPIQSKTLAEVLNQYLPKETTIDFMTIDVEGLDLEILESNDWSKYMPKVIVVECLGEDVLSVQTSPIYEYLTARNYTLWAKTANTCFFSLRNAISLTK